MHTHTHRCCGCFPGSFSRSFRRCRRRACSHPLPSFSPSRPPCTPAPWQCTSSSLACGKRWCRRRESWATPAGLERGRRRPRRGGRIAGRVVVVAARCCRSHRCRTHMQSVVQTRAQARARTQGFMIPSMIPSRSDTGICCGSWWMMRPRLGTASGIYVYIALYVDICIYRGWWTMRFRLGTASGIYVARNAHSIFSNLLRCSSLSPNHIAMSTPAMSFS